MLIRAFSDPVSFIRIAHCRSNEKKKKSFCKSEITSRYSAQMDLVSIDIKLKYTPSPIQVNVVYMSSGPSTLSLALYLRGIGKYDVYNRKGAG